jgi:hypothetical protein
MKCVSGLLRADKLKKRRLEGCFLPSGLLFLINTCSNPEQVFLYAWIQPINKKKTSPSACHGHAIYRKNQQQVILV